MPKKFGAKNNGKKYPITEESSTSIDPLRGDTSLAWAKGDKKPEDKDKFSISPSDDWTVDPDTGKRADE